MKKIKLNKKNVIFLLICLAVVVLGVVGDQVTKGYFQNQYDKGNLPIVIVPDFLEFTFVLNNGAAWGSLSGNNILFFVLTVVALPIFCYFIFVRLKGGAFSAMGFAFVVSGTIGNAIDRAYYGDGFFNGAVRDFLATKFLGRLDFVCNIADILLNVGVIMVILGMLFVDVDAIFKKHPKKSGIEGDTKAEAQSQKFLYEDKKENKLDKNKKSLTENGNSDTINNQTKNTDVYSDGESDDNGGTSN